MSCLTNAKRANLLYYFLITGGRRDEVLPFSKAQSEIQTASSRIWILVADSISYNVNHYSKWTSVGSSASILIACHLTLLEVLHKKLVLTHLVSAQWDWDLRNRSNMVKSLSSWKPFPFNSASVLLKDVDAIIEDFWHDWMYLVFNDVLVGIIQQSTFHMNDKILYWQNYHTAYTSLFSYCVSWCHHFPMIMICIYPSPFRRR